MFVELDTVQAQGIFAAGRAICPNKKESDTVKHGTKLRNNSES